MKTYTTDQQAALDASVFGLVRGLELVCVELENLYRLDTENDALGESVIRAKTALVATRSLGESLHQALRLGGSEPWAQARARARFWGGHCTRGPHFCRAVCPDAFGVPCSPPAEGK